MTIKILTIGDVHAMPSNIPEIEKLIDETMIKVQELKPDYVVVLGDITDRHETVHTKVLLTANKLLLSLAKEVPTCLLIGNHDRPNNSDFLSDIHPFSALTNNVVHNLLIADKVKRVQIKGYTLTFVPYVAPGRFSEALETIPDPYQTDIIFAHQEFYGVQMGAIKSEEGDKWDLDKPFVVTGHIHHYHELQPNIVYVGTPMQVAFSESEDKALCMFQMENGEWTHERIYLNTLRKKTIIMTFQDVLDGKFPKKEENIKYKIVINASNTEMQSLYKHKNYKKLVIEHKVVQKTQKVTVENKTYEKDSFHNRITKKIQEHPDSTKIMEIYKKTL